MKKLLIIAIAALVFASGAAYAAVTLNAAGATFPYPLYSKWFYEYNQQTGTKINYASIGSGGGIAQVKAGTVDFGCSDAPLTGEEQKAANLFMFPTVGGAEAMAYNLPGVKSGLKLTPKMIADIYLGKITNWNDPAITKENPGVALPDAPIIVVHRSDGSGTTNIFTWFLSDVSPEWKSKVGSGTSVSWPVGIGGKGNEGVAGTVKQTSGALGYVELAYVLQNKMTYAMVQNRDGNWLYPSLEGAKEASTHATIPADYHIKFTYSPGKNSYPIAGFTFMLIPKNLPAAKAAEVKSYVKWAFTKGDKDAAALTYVSLPEKLKKKIMADLNKEVK
ncbi:MAG: phosphate ABC transporter substrate-binding protein PstS [Nitrospirota bacterium]